MEEVEQNKIAGWTGVIATAATVVAAVQLWGWWAGLLAFGVDFTFSCQMYRLYRALGKCT